MITSKKIRLILQLFEEKDCETSFRSKVSVKFMTGRKIFVKQISNIKKSIGILIIIKLNNLIGSRR